MVRIVRVAMLFVGAVVGAGFATGREVAVFFAGGGVVNVVIAAVFTAVVCLAFLYLGNIDCIKNQTALFAMRTVVALSALVVYAAMIAAAESLLQQVSGVRFLSIVVVLVSGVFTVKNISAVKWLNFVAVPLIIAIVTGVGAGRCGVPFNGGLQVLRSCGWSAMNMLFAGALMYREGAEMRRADMPVTAILCGVTVGVLLFYMLKSIAGSEGYAMPFLASLSGKLCVLGVVSVLFAIITTMASCNYLAYDYINGVFHTKRLSALLVFAVGFAVASFGFEFIVGRLYGVVSWLGLAVSVAALVCSLCILLKSGLSKNATVDFAQKMPCAQKNADKKAACIPCKRQF